MNALESKPRPSRVRAPIERCAPLALALFVGCAGSPDEPSASPEPTLQRLSASLDSLLCTLIDKVPFPGLDHKCDNATKEATYYEGGFVPTGGLGDLMKLPPLTSTMVQCAVAHSEGSASEGVSDTPVGKFGVETHLSVIDCSVTPQFIEAERVGRIYLFDVPADLDVEGITFSGAQEQRSAGTVNAAHVFTNEPYTQNVDARTGEYLKVTSNNRNWSLGLSHGITIPAGPIEVTIKPGMSHKALYESLNNQLVAPASDLNTLFDFNTQLAPDSIASRAARRELSVSVSPTRRRRSSRSTSAYATAGAATTAGSTMGSCRSTARWRSHTGELVRPTDGQLVPLRTDGYRRRLGLGPARQRSGVHRERVRPEEPDGQ